MTIKEIFADRTLTYEQFTELAKDAKFVDLSEGNYVSKNKFDNEISAKSKEIESLNTTIKTRDTDLNELQNRLKAASEDSEQLSTLSNEIEKLKSKYETDTKALEKQLAEQAYSFAVKEFANTQNFSSGAARRDFEREMLAQNLTMKDGTILGAEDFIKVYTATNADAFVKTEEKAPNGKPMFTKSTTQTNTPAEGSNGFMEAFNFVGVRPKN